MAIEISAIIACRNEGRDIPKCLEALSKQSLRKEKWEAIFVDGGSTDGTVDEIRKFKGRIANLKIMDETGKFKSAANARNIGAKAAKGRVLAFFDADNFIDREYLLEIGRGFEKGIDAASTSSSGMPSKSVWAHLREHETMASNYLVKTGEGVQFVNVMTKKCFERIGGYDIQFTYGEDLKLLDKLRKAKAKFVHLPKVKTHHQEAESLEDIAKQSRSWGKGFHQLFISEPARHFPRLALVTARALWFPLFLVYLAMPFRLLILLVALFYAATIIDGIIVGYRSMKMGGKLKYAALMIPFRMIRSFYFLQGFGREALK
ncbi:MAG: glycosyltransferase [Candidatus Micrarchaeota archaeon]